MSCLLFQDVQYWLCEIDACVCVCVSACGCFSDNPIDNPIVYHKLEYLCLWNVPAEIDLWYSFHKSCYTAVKKWSWNIKQTPRSQQLLWIHKGQIRWEFDDFSADLFSTPKIWEGIPDTTWYHHFCEENSRKTIYLATSKPSFCVPLACFWGEPSNPKLPRCFQVAIVAAKINHEVRQQSIVGRNWSWTNARFVGGSFWTLVSAKK